MLNWMKTFWVVGLLLVAGLAFGTDEVTWSAKVDSGDTKPGSVVTVALTARLKDTWHLYSTTQKQEPPMKTVIEATAPLALAGQIEQPVPTSVMDKNFEHIVEYYEKSATFKVPVKLGPDGLKGALKVHFQVCSGDSCLPPATVEVPISGDAPSTIAAAGAGSAVIKGDVDDQKSKGLLAFIAFAFGAGLLSLLTPCVFPMVPITVSFFAKRKSKSGIAPALAYCGGIVSAFTAFGLIVTVLFGASGIQRFATNPIVNLILAVVFILLALNLFGAYQLSLPISLQNRFSPDGKAGLLAPLLMGLTFTLTSFTCTVPFVGTILVSAAKGDLLYPLVGMLAFSTAFSLPFFLLALFPQYLANLPKAGSWLESVKAFMGFLELAAAVKFLSNADLVWRTGILPRHVFLSIWGVIFGLSALFLLGLIRIPSIPRLTGFSPVRACLAAAMGLLSIWLFSAVPGRSLGELEAFMPPSTSGWLESYEKGLALAKQTNRPMLINFTGVTCTNCRWMEKNMFTQPRVKQQLRDYVKVELYTDRQTPEDAMNEAIEQKLANVVTLPVYVSVSPDGKVLKVFQGSTRDENDFVSFLEMAKHSSLSASR